jgi:hypothetical protein
LIVFRFVELVEVLLREVDELVAPDEHAPVLPLLLVVVVVVRSPPLDEVLVDEVRSPLLDEALDVLLDDLDVVLD